MISIIVPIYNESGNLPELHRRLLSVLKKENFEIIYVNDGSTDTSLSVIQHLPNQKYITVISHPVNLGKSAALQSGFNQSKGDVVVTIDADLQDHPEEIPNLINRLNEGYDLVSGWKYNRHDPWHNVILSRFFNFVIAHLSGVALHDLVCGLKVYRRQVIMDLDLYGEMHRFIPILTIQKGYRVTEVAIGHSPRKWGKSKYGITKFFTGLLDFFTLVFIERFRFRPLHLFGGTGLVLFFTGGVVCSYLTILWVSGESIGRRPLLMLGILLIISGIQLLSLGLLAELIVYQYRKLRKMYDKK